MFPCGQRAAGAVAATVEPLAPARYQVKFTASQELHDKLERLQALMRSSVPDGDLGAIIEAAVTEKLERLEAKRLRQDEEPPEEPGRDRHHSRPRGTSRPRSGAPCTSATGGGAPTSTPAGDAARPATASSSITTARRSAAAVTTPRKRPDDLSHPQRADGRARLRQGEDGAVSSPAARGPCLGAGGRSTRRDPPSGSP